MYKDEIRYGGTQWLIVFLALILAAAVVLVISNVPPQLPVAVILASALLIITLFKTDFALVILIFSMLLSPELRVASVPGREVVLRLDDIFVFVVFFGWLARTAINKELGLLRRTPLNGLIISYIVVCVVSTVIGIVTGNIRALTSLFFILKYIEYFMLYFMVANNVRDERQIKIFVIAFLITCTLTCLATVGQLGRVTAPFEGVQGEPNTLGGYLILLFAVTAVFVIYSSSAKWRFLCGALACFIFVTLLRTHSRGSYLAFVFMYLTLISLSKRGRILAVGTLILGIFILPFTLPKITTGVTQRVAYTFTPVRRYEAFGRPVSIEQSAAARIESWKRVFKQWKEQPFLGYGVTGVGLVDAQYPRVLGETGIVGFLVFLWLLAAIFRNGLYAFNNAKEEWGKGLALGFLAGFVGLLVHATVANTFIIVRIMEPFWFLAAIVMVLPEWGTDGPADRTRDFPVTGHALKT